MEIDFIFSFFLSSCFLHLFSLPLLSSPLFSHRVLLVFSNETKKLLTTRTNIVTFAKVGSLWGYCARPHERIWSSGCLSQLFVWPGQGGYYAGSHQRTSCYEGRFPTCTLTLHLPLSLHLFLLLPLPFPLPFPLPLPLPLLSIPNPCSWQYQPKPCP